MNYRNIGETDLYSSVICFGGATVVSEEDRGSCYQLLDTYVQLGGNFIDTANFYGRWLPRGENTSEQNIGNWMSERGNRRELILATKGGHPDISSMESPRLLKEEVEKDLEDSLQSLQTSYVDLYFLHRDDESLSVPYILEYLNALVDKGKIRYFGCSNWRAERIIEAKEYTESQGLQGFTANQMMWSLAEPNPEAIKDPLLAVMDEATKRLHLETDLAATPYSSLANGFFEKVNKEGPEISNSKVREIYFNDQNLEKYKRVLKLANELSVSITEIALSYLISQPFQTFPVIGSRTVQQLEDSMKAGDLILSREQIAFLEKG